MTRNSKDLLLRSSAIGLFVAAITAPQSVSAQNTAAAGEANQTAEIVVTAQRRAERSVDVPITVTSLDSEALARSNADQLTDIAQVTPALRFDNAGTFFQPTIRGVGTSITTSGGGPNVGIYVDNFLVPNPESAAFELMNIQSIQVLKGPQGTLFGRNTTGGAILVTTTEPGEQTALRAKGSYGRFNEQKYQAYVSTGIAKGIAVDIEGLLHKGNGYFTNVVNDDSKVGQYQNWTVRTGLKAEISDNVSLLLRYVHSDTDDPTALLQNAYRADNGRVFLYRGVPASLYTTRPGYVAVNPAQPISFTNKTDTVQGTLRADLGFADLASYTQYRKDSAINLQDLDITAFNVYGIHIGIDNKTVTQEFLLTSKPGSRLQWTAGLFYFDNRDTYDIKSAIFSTSYAVLSGSSTTTTSYAGFADATYEVTPEFFVTAGGRYGRDKVSEAYFILPGTGVRTPVAPYTTNRFTPRIVARYKPSTASSIYASYAKGFKAGILNVGSYSTDRISPEDINAYEVGYKYDDRVFGVDLSGFYYDYTNLQVSSFQNGQAQIRNAASSRIYGLEGQVRYHAGRGIDFNAGGAYVNAKYKKFPNAPFIVDCTPNVNCGFLGPGSLTQITGDASGQVMQRAPRFSGNIGATYSFGLADGQLKLGGNAYYTSKVYFDPAAQFSEDGYVLLALHAEWEDPTGHLTLGVYGDNVTGKRYISGGNFSTLGIGANWSPPATYGVRIGVKY